MKTTILLVFSLLLVSGSLMGQINKSKYADGIRNRDYSVSKSFYDHHQIDPNMILITKPDFLTVKKSYRVALNNDSLFQDLNTIGRYPDFHLAEEYPGSSRFYAKWPHLNPLQYEKSFIIKPDKTVKYYLIIKDPIRLHPYSR